MVLNLMIIIKVKLKYMDIKGPTIPNIIEIALIADVYGLGK